MALQAEVEALGLYKNDAYWRIDQQVLVTRGGLIAAFAYGCYASQEAYQSGVAAIANDQFEVPVSPVVTPEMAQALDQLVGQFNVEQLSTIAFALGRQVGYEHMKQLPQFENSVDI
jgi:hypothetical protein